jgi:signal transduction histidine kinase
MLHEFLSDNRADLIDRCRLKVAQRRAPRADDVELEHGIPLFLDQLTDTLQREQASEFAQADPRSAAPLAMGHTAARHGRELLHHGFSIDQVVHDYGDLCQAVTDLAFVRDAKIEIGEFRTLNRCLDNAIADAVTQFAAERDELIADKGAAALNERLGFLAHELRNLIHTATLAVTAIKKGNVGLAGATGAVLDRSLVGLRNLIDRSLADVRLSAGMPARRELIPLARFITEIKAPAALEAQARRCGLTVGAVDPLLYVDADRDLLASALGNLLQNGFKYTDADTDVSLNVQAAGERILIEVADHCGGLPPGDAEKMFLPFTQRGLDRSGLGLGLAICRRSVEANDGLLTVRDIPGTGCVFTIDLPRRALPS